MASYHMFSMILFLNAVVEIQLLTLCWELHSLPPAATKAHGVGEMQYFTSVRTKNTCMVWMGYITSEVSHCDISSSSLARASLCSILNEKHISLQRYIMHVNWIYESYF